MENKEKKPTNSGGMDRKLEKKTFTPKRIATGISILLFIAALIYIYVSTAGESRLNVDVERITISTVTNGAFMEYIAPIGTVLPKEIVYIPAIEGGMVEKIYTEAGTHVKKGDPILKLENANLLLSIMFNEGQMYNQENNLRNTIVAMKKGG